MKIALVHDFLKEYGGAERVVEAMHEIWPEAPVYTSFVDYKALGPHAERIKQWDVRASWANNGFMKRMHSPLRFLAPWVWESFDFDGYDAVISSSGWYMCRGIITPPETVHISYIHHPPRHLYGYATSVEWQKYWPVKLYAAVVNSYLRQYDFLAAQRADILVANSYETRRRILKFYRRDADVIYPPVELKNKHVGSRNHEKREYFLCVSRLTRAKHIDLAIAACQELNVPLKIVGKGRDEAYLKSKVESGKGRVDFLGEVSDEDLASVYEGARGLIFPSEDEEFGIVAVEAMSAGVPVIALESGGLPEVVSDGKTGVLFSQLTKEALVKAIHKAMETEFDLRILQARAQRFSKDRFQRSIERLVEDALSRKK